MRYRASILGIAWLLAARAALATQPAAEDDSSAALNARRPGAPSPSSVGITLLGGVTFPTCTGQPESCASSLGPAPSLRGLVLYQPIRSVGFGLVGEVARLHWQTTFPVFNTNAATDRVDSELTVGFVGVAGRFTILPAYVVSPVVELGIGAAFQSETGANFGCNGGVIPSAQLGAGARARVASSFSVFAMGSATGGLKGGCGVSVSDGAPATPFAGFGYGLHLGAAFDIGMGDSA